MMQDNRLAELLKMIAAGDKSAVEEWKCLNRLEQYLICILTRKGIESLGAPLNRLEVLLQALYEVVPENAIEIISARIEPNLDITTDILSARLVKVQEIQD